MYDPGNAATGHPASSYQMVTCWSDGQLFRPPRCRYRALVRFRGTGVTEYSARIASDHSALMPADLITLAHFSVSSAMSLPKSAGDPAWMRNPRSSYLALISARARDALISLLSTSTISARNILGPGNADPAVKCVIGQVLSHGRYIRQSRQAGRGGHRQSTDLAAPDLWNRIGREVANCTCI